MHPDTENRMRAILRQATAKRAPVAKALGVDAYRLLNGSADGAPSGLTLDRYGRWLVLAARAELDLTQVEAWARAALEAIDADGLILKTLAVPVSKSSSRVFSGALSGPVAVHEGDATFLCDLDSGLSTGLFLDHREARLFVRRFAAGAEVLNLFAYTCAFSVHAALGGAARLTSVDAMKRVLERGRENMRASGLDPDQHRWFPDDVMDHVARQKRRGPAYRVVIADPPVLGRAKGATFSLARDLDRLAEGCVGCAAEGGVVLLATHALEIDEARLVAALEGAASAAGRGIEVIARLGLPEWDHPVLDSSGDRGRGEDRDHDRDRGREQAYLKTLVVRIS
jgi:23S rRNA (cytosine1962-C5)-methyltransferase